MDEDPLAGPRMLTILFGLTVLTALGITAWVVAR